MKAEQERLYELLDEIDLVCKKNKVNYYLIGDELLRVAKGKNHFRCRADVCMTYQVYEMIVSELEKLPDRRIENLHTNKKMPGVYYRFVDTTSFMIELSYHKVIRECGIAVNVHIIRKDCQESEELERLESVMDSEIEGVKRSISHNDRLKLESLKSVPDYADKIKDMLKGCALKDDEMSEASRLKLPTCESFVFPPGFWEKSSYVSVAGRKYMTVGDVREYLMIHYGNPDDIIAHADTFLNRVMCDAEIPYSEVAEDILAELDDGEYWEKRNFLYDEYFERYDKYIRERNKAESYMRAAAERIVLWKQYYPQKEKIRQLFKERHFDELRLLFGDMESSINRFEASGFLCVFDKEIWDTYIRLLKVTGDKTRAEELEKLYEENPFRELKNMPLSYSTNSEQVLP